MIKFLLVLFIFLPSIAIAAPVLNYSDLINGPATGGQGDTDGAFVTVWGSGFGSIQGESYVTCGEVGAAAYPVWSDTKISFQIDATASTGSQTISVTTSEGTSNTLSFYVNSVGDSVEVYFCDITNGDDSEGNGSYGSPWATPNPFIDGDPDGQILYVRAGTYNSHYGYGSSTENIVLYSDHGSANKYNAMIAYPGESVEFLRTESGRHITVGNALDESNYWVFSQLELDGGGYRLAGINTGGSNCSDASCEESGSANWRIVNIEIHNCFKTAATTMTGVITTNGDNYQIYGCSLRDIGNSEDPYSNDHAIYVRVGSDDVTIAWNHLYDNSMGYQIICNTDHANEYGVTWENIRIHNNFIEGGPVYDDARGVGFSSYCHDNSTYYVYSNIFKGIRASNGSVGIYRGTLNMYNNTFYDCGGSNGTFAVLCSYDKTLNLRNNIFHNHSDEAYYFAGTGGCGSGSGSLDLINVSANNLYYGGTGSLPSVDTAAQTTDPLLNAPNSDDFSLQEGSPAINNGTSDVSAVVTRDYNNVLWSGTYDIGAYSDEAGEDAQSSVGVGGMGWNTP